AFAARRRGYVEPFCSSVETAELDHRGQRRELISTKACLIHVADPPSSAILNENPPWGLRIYSGCRFSNSLADGSAPTCGFAEFSSKWRTGFSIEMSSATPRRC